MHIAFSIKAIADDVEREFKAKGVNIKFSERALTRVGQIVSNQLENQYARDLYTYAKWEFWLKMSFFKFRHAGRSIPTIDDVKLLYHRNPEIKRRVDELANLSSDVLPFSRKKSVEFDHQTLNEAVFPTEKCLSLKFKFKINSRVPRTQQKKPVFSDHSFFAGPAAHQ
jgi:hypothetical protein